MKAIAIAIALIAIGLGHGRTAHAGDDDTGGSVGGGDWSESSAPSSSSSDSYSSSAPTPAYSSGDYANGGSTGGGGPGVSAGAKGFLIGAFSLILVVAIVSIARDAATVRPNAPSGTTDVTVLRVALDARTRPHVQAELARIAASADTTTADGRATLLREVALMLRRLRDAWVYGGAVNEPMRPIAAAHAVFQRHVDDARARFRHELVRNEQGAITRADAPAQHATSDDGPGLMLVSIVVAARHELFTVAQITDGEELRQAFESLSSMIASELIAVEIVWMPADPAQRLSSIALEAAYPAPQLHAIAGATVGKVFCAYCGAPYPAEAIACPSCGGRAAPRAA